MLYLFLGKNKIKLLALKKSVMGQYETSFFDKDYQTDLFNQGKINSTDLIASAVKEILINIKNQFKEKEVYLILPQNVFQFFRTTIPSDIASSAVEAFVIDKARSEWQTSLENFFYDFFIEETDKQSAINLFAIEKENFQKLKEAFGLIDYKITEILPETVAYFKLFDKTLRKEKNEKILYATLENKTISGYLYDGVGLLSPENWQITIPEESGLEATLKVEINKFAEQGQKLSRLILSGPDSEKIRQDTFTKAVGVWTNPLKRIASGFYEEQLKLFINSGSKNFSILRFDVCFGAFLFNQENKRFSILKKASRIKNWSAPKVNLPKIKLPLKEIFIFLISFILSFILFIFISKNSSNFFSLPKINSPLVKISPTPTITLTPTPTPGFKKEELKIKVLNGSGVKGKATEVKDFLTSKGYGEILTGNADNFDYPQSVIQVKKDRQQAADWLKKDLKEYVSNFKISSLEENQAADLVLIIGQDFK